ncbi:MAG: IreB family regulatory phosphoprotein [Firmicutes bacterium]|nr:IreB family regulatory phosphoprotein [Bacillota bacterium]
MSTTDETRRLWDGKVPANEADAILREVYVALRDKGYNPISQLVGYLLSGDPAYITNYHGARNAVRRIDRDELLEELLRQYVQRVDQMIDEA